MDLIDPSSASSPSFPPPPALFFQAFQDALVKLPKKPGRLCALYSVSCTSWEAVLPCTLCLVHPGL